MLYQNRAKSQAGQVFSLPRSGSHAPNSTLPAWVKSRLARSIGSDVRASVNDFLGSLTFKLCQIHGWHAAGSGGGGAEDSVTSIQ